MAGRRLRRGDQVELNRGRLLTAARQVFLERGFHGATLDAIAEEAGFSKGVVYSQFESKADLFLALLEQRIAERAEENERTVREAGGAGSGLAAVLELAGRRMQSEIPWNLLLIEFRAQAAREPALNERYAKLHARTIDGIAGGMARTLAEMGVESPWPPQVLAAFALAVGTGVLLENVAAPGSLPGEAVADLVTRSLRVAPQEGS